jgi:YVTN family beta-propeller protein
VSRIDPRTSSVTKAISVGDQPAAVATGGGSVWVANSGDGSVSRIDPRTDRVIDTFSVGHSPQGVAVAGGAAWVTVRP